jgi:hypothetical protein
MERLQDSLDMQQQGAQIGPEQMEMFWARHILLESWVRRQRVDKVWGAAGALLTVLGV